MTLVIASRLGGAVRFMADTQISDETRRAQQVVRDAALKVVQARDVVVAFAGVAPVADRALQRWFASDGAGFDDAVAAFLAAHLDFDESVDFLVASSSPRPRLVRISHGAARGVDGHAAIGDLEAFDHHEALVLEGVGEEEAFDTVLASAEFPGVAGFRVDAHVTPDGVYYPFEFVTRLQDHPIAVQSKEYVSLPPPRVRLGQYAHSRFPVLRDGRHVGVSFYVAPARVGVLFVCDGSGFPLGDWRSEIGPLAFREWGAAEHGVLVQSGASETPEMVQRVGAAISAGQTQEALELISNVVPAPSEFVDVSIVRSDLHLQMNEHDEALAALDRAIAHQPGNSLARVKRGYLYFLLDRLDDAESDFTAAVEAEPDFVQAWRWRASVRTLKGDVVGAVDDLEAFRRRCLERDD